MWAWEVMQVREPLLTQGAVGTSGLPWSRGSHKDLEPTLVLEDSRKAELPQRTRLEVTPRGRQAFGLKVAVSQVSQLEALSVVRDGRAQAAVCSPTQSSAGSGWF